MLALVIYGLRRLSYEELEAARAVAGTALLRL